MIRDLEVWNFQGHKNTLIEFDNGVNIIKGRSHSGKSSIIRALRWALYNKPSGFSFKSHFAKKKDNTDVSIEFDNANWISRQRNNKFNGYKLSNFAGQLEALRTDVPEEVKAITQLSDINFQSQADKYYMLQETPGTVAKELNKIVGLDIIDKVDKVVSRKINHANSSCVHLEKDIKEKKAELEKYKNLDKIEKLVDVVTLLAADFKMYKAQSEELTLHIDKVIGCEDDIGNLTDWLEIESSFDLLKKKQKRYIELQNKMVDISKIVKNGKNIEDRIWATDQMLLHEDDIKEAQKLVKERSEMQNKQSKLQKLCSDVQDTQKTLKSTTDSLTSKIKQRAALIKKHSKEFCSKCGAHMQYWRKKT